MRGADSGAAVGDQSELSLTQSSGGAPPVCHALKEGRNKLVGFRVLDLPERRHDCTGAGKLKCLSKARDALAGADFSQGCFTGREDYDFGSAKINTNNLKAGQKAVVETIGPMACVKSSQREPATEQGAGRAADR